jgi:hypothetical protein
MEKKRDFFCDYLCILMLRSQLKALPAAMEKFKQIRLTLRNFKAFLLTVKKLINISVNLRGILKYCFYFSEIRANNFSE